MGTGLELESPKIVRAMSWRLARVAGFPKWIFILDELIGFARKIFKYRKIGDLAQPPCGVARLPVPAASGRSVETSGTP